VAWTNADDAVQVHGVIGYAVERRISRVLCDARVLNVFKGFHANIVIRGLLGA
jgi:(2S)-methylsuccinyl-CoA dehydrogenase